MQDRDWVLLIGGIIFFTASSIIGVIAGIAVALYSRTMVLGDR